MLVTNRELQFVDAGHQTIVPAGTRCVVYNRQLNPRDDADLCLERAQALNFAAGEKLRLVMLLNDHPRILERDWLEPMRQAGVSGQASGVSKERTPPPAAAAPKVKQASLF